MNYFISLFLLMFVMGVFFISYLSTPLSLAGLYFFFVIMMSLMGYLFMSDFVSYMLYLIYVGGLLVLLVYMVIISTNYLPANLLYTSVVTLTMVSSFFTGILLSVNYVSLFLLGKTMASGSMLEMNSGLLIGLVLLLLYAFLYICESIRLGGRTLNVGSL